MQEFIDATTFASFHNSSYATTTKYVEALRIRNCATFEKSLSGLSSDDFREFFLSKPDLRLVTIIVEGSLKEAMKQNFELKDFKFDCNGRPWIVIISCPKEKIAMTFFKDAEFSYICIVNGVMTNQGQPCDKNRHSKLVREILLNISRSPKLSLVDLSLTLEPQNLLNEKGILCRKFFKFFVDSESEPARKRRKIESIIELEIRNQRIKPAFRNYNELMTAIEAKDEDTIETLMGLDFDLAQRGNDNKRAVDLAFDNEMFDVVVKLIEEDSPFPVNDFMTKLPRESKALGKLEVLRKERSDFHRFVSTGDKENLRTKISQNLKLKFAYDIYNKSALTCAINYKQFEMFAFLQAKGFSKGIDPFFDAAWKHLTADEKNEIARCNLKHLQSATSEHVSLLISKTNLTSRVPDRIKSYEDISKFYNDLDAIPGLSELFRVVALYENLKIRIDSESSTVHRMFQPKYVESRGVFSSNGFIYIATGQRIYGRNEILGVIAHEFAHCAMYEIYKNNFLPYKADDVERNEEFAKIVKSTQTIVKDHPERIISSMYDAYLEEEWPSELIVRVPQMLAQYKDDDGRIKSLRATFSSLFTFFETKTLLDLSRYLGTPKFTEQVKTFNEDAGLLKLVKKEEIEFEANPASKCFNELFGTKINIVMSNSTVHSMAAIIKHLDQRGCVYIITDLNFLVNQISNIQKLFESNRKLFVIINCADQFHKCQKKFIETIQGLEVQKIFLVVDESSKKQELLKLNDEIDLSVFTLSHKWRDLRYKYQSRIRQKVINFQGKTFSLSDFLPNVTSSSVLDCLPLKEFVGNKRLTIKGNAMKSLNFYFRRKFFVQTCQSQDSIPTVSCDYLVYWVEKDSVAIISGTPGSGKSTELKEIAMKLKQKFPSRWLSLVDLKQHLDVFKDKPSNSKFEEIAFKLTRSHSGNDIFERELFDHFYANGRLLLLLDGFDEVPAEIRQNISDFLLKFERKKGNQLWITTQLHLQSHLEKLFGVSTFQILPFNEHEQMEFLSRYWRKNSEPSNPNQNLEKYSKSVLKNLKEFLNCHSELIGIPILLEIIGSNYQEEDFKENAPKMAHPLNLYSLYEEFVDRKIEIWRRVKKQHATESECEQKQTDRSEITVWNVHQKLAMKLLLNKNGIEKFGVSVEYDEEVWTKEALSRVGLVLSSDDPTAGPEFFHRTFADFLVAQSVVESLKSENQMLALKVFMIILGNDQNAVVQFFNSALNKNQIESSSVESVNDEVKEFFKRKIDGTATIMETILNNYQELIFQVFMKIASQILTVDETKLMLKEKDERGRNIVCCMFCVKWSIERHFELLRNILTDEEIVEIIFNVDNEGNNFLHHSLDIADNSSEKIRDLFDVLKVLLSNAQQKQLMRMRNHQNENIFATFSCSSENGRKFELCLEALIKNVRKILPAKEVREMLKASNHEKFLYFVNLNHEKLFYLIEACNPY